MRAMYLVVALFCGNYQLCPLMKSTAAIRHAFNMVLEVHGMASVRLQPPPPFDFRNPDEWLCWKWRFEQFCQVSSWSTRYSSTWVTTQRIRLHPQTFPMEIEVGTWRWLPSLMPFPKYIWNNMILKHTRVNWRNQEEGMSAEQFITSLNSLVDNCAYTVM